MKYAMIGMGFIFPRHVKAIRDVGSEIVLTCDIDPNKNADFLDYREMFESKIMEDVDAISICTPNYLHAEMVRDAVRTGKKVMCEKPLTINTDFTGLESVGVVHQLHFHPLFDEICGALKKSRNVRMVLRASRDTNFWNSWKGDEIKSGGVVYILGSHIFDLLLHAIPEDYRLTGIKDTMKKSTGTIVFNNTIVDFHLEFLDSREGQTRHLEINGRKYQLSVKDNLSFEGLHDKVYEAFEAGELTSLEDAQKSINLIDEIKKTSN